jgi:hypothetical protein
MTVRITSRPVTPEELATLLEIPPAREQAIANLTGYKINNRAKSHAYRTTAKRKTHKFAAKKAAKRR